MPSPAPKSTIYPSNNQAGVGMPLAQRRQKHAHARPQTTLKNQPFPRSQGHCTRRINPSFLPFFFSLRHPC